MVQNLYFIAIIPPEKICDEIEVFKKDMAARFSSKTALRVVPHITLKNPFTLPSRFHQEVIEWFQSLALSFSPFTQELDGFDSFSHPNYPVIFVKPVMSLPLYELQKVIIQKFRIQFPFLAQIKVENIFKPHMTIAYRDLSFLMFTEAMKEYKSKEYKTLFSVDNFHLLQHDGKRWNTIQTYPA